MTVSFGRDFDTRPAHELHPLPIHNIGRPGWLATVLAAYVAEAQAHPLSEHEADTVAFKVYDEIPGEAEGQRELVVECKIALSARIGPDGATRLCAQLFPLRGTDYWVVVRGLLDHLGEPDTCLSIGEDGCVLWWPPSE